MGLSAAMVLPVAAEGPPAEPLRILLTNDDGIDEVESRVYPLAQELRKFAEVTIVVADRDRSGSSNLMSLNRKLTLESRLRYRSEAEGERHRLEIHTVDGYPADCVLLGVRGLLRETPPDLVISGPNGGANLGDEWYGSGTVGAARTAAYLGIPALAISGLDSDAPEQVAALSRWVAELARSELVRTLPELTYLTVGFPRLPPEEIAGVRLARRARQVDALGFRLLDEIRRDEGDDEVTSVWALHFGGESPPPDPESDVARHAQGYIVVTPMRADEHHEVLLERWLGASDLLPPWSSR